MKMRRKRYAKTVVKKELTGVGEFKTSDIDNKGKPNHFVQIWEVASNRTS